MALGSMCSFIKTECKSNMQYSITSFKHNVDRADSKSEFGLRIRAGKKTQDNQITRQVESESNKQSRSYTGGSYTGGSYTRGSYTGSHTRGSHTRGVIHRESFTRGSYMGSHTRGGGGGGVIHGESYRRGSYTGGHTREKRSEMFAWQDKTSQ